MPLTLGSRAQLGIGIALYLQDRYSAEANRANATLKKLHKDALSYADQQARRYQASSTAIAGGAALVSYGLLQAAKSGANFQHRINQIYILGEGKIGKSRKDLQEMSEQMAYTFGKKPIQVSEALLENVKAGVTGNLAEITRYQLAVSAASGEALEGEEGVAYGLLGIMNQMGIISDQTYNMAGKQVTGIARVSNAVLTAANSSMASVNDVNESMKYFGNTAHITNMTLEQSLSLIAKLSQGTIRGTAAGTALNNMVIHLTKNVGMFMSKHKAYSWKVLGIDPKEIVQLVNAGKIYESLFRIFQGMEHLNLEDKIVVLNELLNVRGDKALITAFTKTGGLTLGQYLGTITQGAGSNKAISQSQQMMNDLSGDFLKFGTTWEIMKNQFTRSAMPVLRAMVHFGTKVVQVLSSFMGTGLGKLVTGVVVVVTPLIGILFAFRAAAIAATFALRGMVGQTIMGGGGLFGNIRNVLGGGPAGMARGSTPIVGSRVNYGGSGFENIKFNKYGNPYVGKGGTVNFGGKTWTAGQAVPGSVAGMGGTFATGGAGIATGFAGVAGTVGKATGFLGGIFGTALRFLPVVGGVLSLIGIASSIFGLMEEDHQKPNEYLQAYDRALFRQMLASPTYKPPTSFQPQSGRLVNNEIVVNIDGVAATKKRVQNIMDEGVDSSTSHKFSY